MALALSRREVTHKHQRMTLAVLMEDIPEPFETLSQHPNLVLRQLGSPFAAQGPVADAASYIWKPLAEVGVMCAAVTRPTMRFVPIKEVQQQAL